MALFESLLFPLQPVRHAAVAIAILAAAFTGMPPAIAGTYEPFNQAAFTPMNPGASPA